MPPPPSVPGVGLVAILLVTRSRPGPRLVFHYPEDPLHNLDTENTPNDADISDDSSDDDEIRISRTPVHARTTRFADISELTPSLGKMKLQSGKPVVGGEILTGKVLGHSVESLEKVLSPGRWSDGKKFEICMDGFTYLGHPIYANEDGYWSTKPHREAKPKRNGHTGGGGLLDLESFQHSENTTPINIDTNITQEKADYDFTHIPDSFESKSPTPNRLGTSMDSSSTNSNIATSEKMTMFQIVLVLSPSKAAEASILHTQILAPLTAALHHCQKQFSYVSHESRTLLALKQKAKQKPLFTRQDELAFHKSLLEASGLAWSLSEIYSKISMGQIAEFRLSGLEMSLCTQSLDGPKLTPHSALLLLSPPEKLLAADLAAKPEAAPLTHILPVLTPSKSISALATSLAIPLPSLMSLSQHLLLYRKALLLPAPLHWRNMYVVSPTAPVAELGRYVEEYAALFPTLPSLPNMLKVLSGKVIRYGVLVPSRDHRAKYLEILGWLVKEGWVVQVRRWGWVRVPRWMLLGNRRAGSGGTGDVAVSFDDDSGSVSSERTAIANNGNGKVPPGHRRLSELLAERNLFGQRRGKRGSDTTIASGSVFSNPSIAIDEDEDEECADGLILVQDPSSEPHLLEHLQNELFEDEESREILAKILPLFDGEHAFEEFATSLGLRRSGVERVIEGLEERGWIRGLKSI